MKRNLMSLMSTGEGRWVDVANWLKSKKPMHGISIHYLGKEGKNIIIEGEAYSHP